MVPGDEFVDGSIFFEARYDVRMTGQVLREGDKVTPRPVALEQHALVHGRTTTILSPSSAAVSVSGQELLDKVESDNLFPVLCGFQHPLFEAPGAPHKCIINL